jgi:biopolymer transport protein ExbB
MPRIRISARPGGALAGFCLAALAVLALVGAGNGPEAESRRSIRVSRAGGQEVDLLSLEALQSHAGWLLRQGFDWYHKTPPGDRMIWTGLAACAGLGLVVLIERLCRLRRRRIIPADFTARFLDRLHEGRLDGGRALDYCEMNPSPAARIALAAVRRWGRPAIDLERAVALAHRVEAERLRRNAGSLRRIAALAPLLGVLGTLLRLQQVLSGLSAASPSAWGPGLAAALSPLTTGLAIATLAMVAYDALYTKIEGLSGALDRLGAETIDAIAMSKPPAAGSFLGSGGHTRSRADVAHQGHPAMAVGFDRAVPEGAPAERRGEE